jgi:hypothetical protein
MARKICGLLLLASLIGVLGFVIFSQRATLTALEQLRVDDQAAVGGVEVTQIAEIEPGTRLPIAECLDTKSDRLFAVELPDGRLGYVNIGKIRVEVEPLWSMLSGPIAFGCVPLN